MKYLVHVDVRRARGRQSWEVIAESAQEAIKKFQSGQGVCTFEEFEADEYGVPMAEEAP